MNPHTTNSTESTLTQLRELKWVQSIYESDRNGSSHRIVTNQSALRMDHEIHTLQNIGITVNLLTQAGEYGVQVYVDC